MIEKFTESKPIETIEIKEAFVKKLAREMLERFRVKFKREEKVEHIEEPTPLPEPVAVEDVEITAEEEEQQVAAEPQQPEKSEISEIIEPPVLETKKEREKKTDKGDFESIVTNNYFEGWDEDVELEGNPEIKEQIRQNIIKAEKENQRIYENTAYDLGIPIEEFKARLQEKIEDMVECANFFRATQVGVLEKIMTIDGRWKSQFEVGTSQGTLDPEYRAAAEMKMFGFNKPKDSEVPFDRYNIPEEVLQQNKERRPIYGYFSDEEHGAINSDGKIPPPNNVRQYGNVNFKIKKEKILRRSTITFHDSLGGGDWPPTPATKPHFTSFRLSHSSGNILNKLKNSSTTNWNEDYTEVQFHGGLTMEDVESIHVSANNGIYQEDVEKIRMIFEKYKEQHPESTVQLIEF